jgi:hypothetical protein
MSKRECLGYDTFQGAHVGNWGGRDNGSGFGHGSYGIAAEYQDVGAGWGHGSHGGERGHSKHEGAGTGDSWVLTEVIE